MRKHRLIWFVWVSFPEELSDDQYSKYIDLCTAEARKYDTPDSKTHSASFCTFYHIRQAEKFAQFLAGNLGVSIDIISNRQRRKWKNRGKYTGYYVTIYRESIC